MTGFMSKFHESAFEMSQMMKHCNGDVPLLQCNVTEVFQHFNNSETLLLAIASQTFLGDRFISVSVDEAIATVTRAINGTLRELFDPSHTRTPHDLFSIFRLPSTPQAQRATRAAEIYERTLEIIYDYVRGQRDLGGNVTHGGESLVIGTCMWSCD